MKKRTFVMLCVCLISFNFFHYHLWNSPKQNDPSQSNSLSEKATQLKNEQKEIFFNLKKIELELLINAKKFDEAKKYYDKHFDDEEKKHNDIKKLEEKISMHTQTKNALNH